ncbi:MAG TPA: class I SAM-dependent methyltransferase [Flavobacteriales bacterium]|nr:class I SAM-dependent methyltransferase [Flavobacteriales bacterium]
MDVKEHYETHLGEFYSWMAGDFGVKQNEFYNFLHANNIFPSGTGMALDLGSAHGIQSSALAKAGFTVRAVDFNDQLLKELKENCINLPVACFEDDIRNVKAYKDLKPELIICWGDTLTHLDNKKEVFQFLDDCAASLNENGKLLLSFRDYSTQLEGPARFIPVAADESRILTCFLEYDTERVTVTDLLHQKNQGKWTQKASSYKKVRVSPTETTEQLHKAGLTIMLNTEINRMHIIIATK